MASPERKQTRVALANSILKYNGMVVVGEPMASRYERDPAKDTRSSKPPIRKCGKHDLRMKVIEV